MQDMYWNEDPRSNRIRIAPPAPTISSHHYPPPLDGPSRLSNVQYDPAFPLDPQSSTSSSAARWNSYDLNAEERSLKAKLSSTYDNPSSFTTHQPPNHSSYEYDRYRDSQRTIREDDYYDRLPVDSRLTENISRAAPPLDDEDTYFRRPRDKYDGDGGVTKDRYNVQKSTITDSDIHEYLESRRRHEVDAFRRTRYDDILPQATSSLEFSRPSKPPQHAFSTPSATILDNSIDDSRYFKRMESESQPPSSNIGLINHQASRLAPPRQEETVMKEKVVAHYIVLEDIPEEGKLVNSNSTTPHALFRRKVTHVDGMIGFAGTDLFFQMSKVTGPVLPQIGSLVLIKAEKVSSMPFSWSALTVDVINLYPPKDEVSRSSAAIPTGGGRGSQNREGQFLETIPLNLPSTTILQHDSMVTSQLLDTPPMLKGILKNKPPPIISATQRGGTWRGSSPKRKSPDIIIEKAYINKKPRSPSPSQRRIAPQKSPSPRSRGARGGESSRPSQRRRSRSISPLRRRRSTSISPRRRSITSPRKRSISPRRRSPRRRSSRSPPIRSRHSRSRSPPIRSRHSRSRSPPIRSRRSRSRSPIRRRSSSRHRSRSPKRRRSRSRSIPKTLQQHQLVSLVQQNRSIELRQSSPKPLMSLTTHSSLNEKRDRNTSTTKIVESNRTVPTKKPALPVSFTWSTTTKSKPMPLIEKKSSTKKEQPKAFIVLSDKSPDKKNESDQPRKDDEAKKKITNEIVKNIQQVREKLKNDQFKIGTQVTGSMPSTAAIVPNPLFTAVRSAPSLPLQVSAPPPPNLSIPGSLVPNTFNHNLPYGSNNLSQQHPNPYYNGPRGGSSLPPPPRPMPPMQVAYPSYMYQRPQQQQPPPPPHMNFNPPPFMPPVNNAPHPFFRPPYVEPTHVRRTTVLTSVPERFPPQKPSNKNLRPPSGNLVLLKNPWSDPNAKGKEPLPPGEDASSKMDSSKALSKTTPLVINTSNSTNASGGTNDNAQNSSSMEQQQQKTGGSESSSSTVDSADFGDVQVKPKSKRRRNRTHKRKKSNKQEENWDLPTATTVAKDKDLVEEEQEENWDLLTEETMQSNSEINPGNDDDEICVINIKPANLLFEEEYIEDSNIVDKASLPNASSQKNISQNVKKVNANMAKKKAVATSVKAIINKTAVTTKSKTQTVTKSNVQSTGGQNDSNTASKSQLSKTNIVAVKSSEQQDKKPPSSNVSGGGSSTNSKLSDKLTDVQKKKLLEKEKETIVGSVGGIAKSNDIQKDNPVKATTDTRKLSGAVGESGENSRYPPPLMNLQLVKKVPPLSSKLTQKSREELQQQILRDEKEKQLHRLANTSSYVNPIPSHSNYSHSRGGGSSSSNSFSFRSHSPSRTQNRYHQHHQVSSAAVLQEPVIRISRRRSLSPPPRQSQPQPHHHNQHQSLMPFVAVDPLRVVAVKQLEIQSLELRDRELQYEMNRLLVERKSFAYNSQYDDQQRYY